MSLHPPKQINFFINVIIHHAHLFFNMFALFMFGRTLEYVWGPKRFLIFYVVAGVGAGLVQEAVGAMRYFSLAEGIDADMLALVFTSGGRKADYEYNARKKASEAEVDKILEKIKKGGYASLTEDEKKRLFDASAK